MPTSLSRPILPDELLEAVLNHIPMRSMRKKARLSLLLTCRKWAYILEQQLFCSLIIRYRDKPGPQSKDQKRFLALLNILDLKPYLCRFVRSLNVQIYIVDEWVTGRVIRLLELCSTVETFVCTSRTENDRTLETSDLPIWEDKYVTILRKVGGLAHLRNLYLKKVNYDIFAVLFGRHKLKTLYLCCPMESVLTMSELQDGVSYEGGPTTPSVDELMGDSEDSACATQTPDSRSISVGSDPDPDPYELAWSPEITEIVVKRAIMTSSLMDFLRWARNVKSISLEHSHGDPFNVSYKDVPSSEFTSMLGKHRHTLTSLSITGPRIRLGDYCSLSCCPNLKHLKLTSQLICIRAGFCVIRPEDVVMELPHLETFQIDLFCGRGYWLDSSYGNPEYQKHVLELLKWMEMFASLLCAQQIIQSDDHDTSAVFRTATGATKTLPSSNQSKALTHQLRTIKVTDGNNQPRPVRRGMHDSQYRIDWWSSLEELLAPCQVSLEWVGPWPDRALEQSFAEVSNREQMRL